MPHVNKKFRSLTEFFSHLNFSLSRKQRYEQKITLSTPLSILFSKKITPKSFLFRVSFPASKFTPIKLILKKDFSNIPLRIVKKTAPQYNSNSLNCTKGERLNNSRLRG